LKGWWWRGKGEHLVAAVGAVRVPRPEGEEVRTQESLAGTTERSGIERQLAFDAIQTPTAESLDIGGECEEAVQRDLVCGELRQEVGGTVTMIEPGELSAANGANDPHAGLATDER